MIHSSKASVTLTTIVVAFAVVASTAVNALLMNTTPAYAAPSKEKVIVRTDVTAATGLWQDISVDVPGIGTVIGASIRVIESDTGTEVFVGFETEEGNLAFGSTTLDEGGFEIDSKLTSATLSPVSIDVTIFDEAFSPIGTGEVTVQATWEGIGDILSQKTKVRTDLVGLREKLTDSVESRVAIAEATVNGADLGTAESAQMATGKTVQMTVIDTAIT